MSNNDQTEFGNTGKNLFVRDFCAPHLLAYTKKMPRSFFSFKKIGQIDTQTRAISEVFFGPGTEITVNVSTNEDYIFFFKGTVDYFDNT
jgi:hypothetical protein